MNSSRRLHRTIAPLIATVLIVTNLLGSTGSVAAEPVPAVPTAKEMFGGPGPHKVITSTVTKPCEQSFVGSFIDIAYRLFGSQAELKCSGAFPYGAKLPIGVNTYYPADIASSAPVPLVAFVGGITTDPGMYDNLARQWASYGYIVVNAYDIENTYAYMHALALTAAIVQNRDRQSPLFGKVDLSRTVVAGQSAGGGSAMQTAALLPPVAKLIDPRLNLAGALLIQPGPIGAGFLMGVPSFFLTGYNDVIVPDFAWVRWWQYNMTFWAPSWIANAYGESHFASYGSTSSFGSSGTLVAWLEYITRDNAKAKSLFVGPNWGLKDDPQFFTAERNAKAQQLK